MRRTAALVLVLVHGLELQSPHTLMSQWGSSSVWELLVSTASVCAITLQRRTSNGTLPVGLALRRLTSKNRSVWLEPFTLRHIYLNAIWDYLSKLVSICFAKNRFHVIRDCSNDIRAIQFQPGLDKIGFWLAAYDLLLFILFPHPRQKGRR